MEEASNIYYLLIKGEKEGPYHLEDFKGFPITAKTLVWTAEKGGWYYAEEYAELAVFLPRKENITPVSEPFMRTVVPPKTWLLESILVTIFCCMPAGVVGLIYAVQVRDMITLNRLELAYKYSSQARVWTIVSFSIGIVLLIVWLLLLLLGVFAGMKEELDWSYTVMTF